MALAAGRPVVARGHDGERSPAVLWVTDAAMPDATSVWSVLADQFPRTGLWPLLVQGLYDGSGRPWDNGEFQPASEEEIAAVDVRQVLEESWHDSLVPINDPWAPGTGPLAPFHPTFPGLAPMQQGPPVETFAPATGSSRIGLVSCRRPADAIGVVGWEGAINKWQRAAEVSAVLRSWEDRFGAIVVGLGFATITLLVTRPPETDDDALRVAAEVAALCPDALWQPEALMPDPPRDATLESMSRLLVRDTLWRLWFD
ncbi:DUF4253 domain-containing protein [Petropleomorpha daqingensis]|uniref:DUF4253 domain-containing protein n=1 Tax=Petropleomorpha daqingensis TaxID=2026353 RepID=A0A853CBZ9_9ACTN|nr:hypothetical protein [Petropleomorpha daqingensis]